ncbi:uncharacterized protein MKK02DRAFT_32901 [Dioszegia hungarica]|uniref:Uncharacterized protein n=1 Tax=Dioszegia hungarica TaxID=4972 RepID=A0AA38H6H8_9TREE|nr:uncharacterized protein MKK02DRAFT_32901 [Dioszegia hungarica]KAI9635492.1 hypothetical protein MKK02DRAFT_32901 [Dioszegia hungarica]
MSTNFSGGLSGRRRADLVEIAEALGLDTSVTVVELKDSIQKHLDDNEADLSTQPRFKGLYGRRRTSRNDESDTDTVSGEGKAEAKSVARTARKSMSRAVDRVQATFDAAGIPLPDTPLAHKVAGVANKAAESATEVAAQTVDLANNAVVAATNASQALVPTKQTQRQLRQYWNKTSNVVMKYANEGQKRVDVGVTPVREFLSSPQNLIVAFLSIELAHLLLTSSQSYNHTLFFPPAGGSTGSLDSLVGGLFSWAPKVQFTIRVPEWANWSSTSQVWGALSWWIMGTVVPALAGSSLIQMTHPAKHKGVTTRHQAAQHKQTFDPLVFALLRFFLLLWPLTTAAPTAMVDALEMTGNLQGRALAAGLMAGLVAGQQFSNSS